MKSIVLSLILLSAVNVAHAQIVGGTIPGISNVLPIIPSFGGSTSALDSAGNLFIFDVSFSRGGTLDPSQLIFSRIPIAIKTRVTVVTNTGTRLTPVDIDGSVQVLGTGRHAVYALSNSTSSGPTTSGAAFVPARRLLALSLASGALVSPIPSTEVSFNTDVKLAAAADAGAPDVLSVVDGESIVFIMGAAPAVRRFAKFVKYYSGTGFVVGTPIPLQ
jgi:hypothetical protein